MIACGGCVVRKGVNTPILIGSPGKVNHLYVHLIDYPETALPSLQNWRLCSGPTALSGRWQGWKDARVEMVVAGGTGHNITVSVVYVKMPTGLPYEEWDSLR